MFVCVRAAYSAGLVGMIRFVQIATFAVWDGQAVNRCGRVESLCNSVGSPGLLFFEAGEATKNLSLDLLNR